VTIKKIVLLIAALRAMAGDALAAGSISGRVTSSTTTLGLAGTVIQVFDLDHDRLGPTTTTDATGNYTIALPPGNYAVFTQDTHGYINEIYDNIPCSAVCDTSTVTVFAVANAAITGINFVLDPGGRIQGTVTAAGGAPLAGVTVLFLDPNDQLFFTKGVTDASGHYISEGGTATGNVFAITSNTLGYQDEAYDNIKCLFCNLTVVGTPIPVTLGGTATADFALDPGGRISGTVRDGSSNPLAGVFVRFFGSTGNELAESTTDASGNYISAAFPTGSYFIKTQNELGFVDELFDNLECPGTISCITTSGTAVPVTVGATTTGRDFALAPGGNITGTVTNAVTGLPIRNMFVGIFAPNGGGAGAAVTNEVGFYRVTMPPGTYAAAIRDVPGYANQLYNGLPCAGNCSVGSGTQIPVTTGATTGNINFALVPGVGGTITGTLTNAATSAVIANANVQVLTAAGTLIGSVPTNASGVYTLSGLAPGQYYVRTNAPQPFINQLHSGVVCTNCAVTASGGTLITLTAGSTATINFSLASGGRITGTVTNSAGGAALQGIAVQLFGSAGQSLGSYATNASGNYGTPALPPGTYFLKTAATAAQNFIDKVYSDVPCVPCSVGIGTAVSVIGTATTANINFALTTGGLITGTVTDASAGGAPIPAMSILVVDSAGVLLKNTTTDASGNYAVGGLPTGTYFVRTNPNALTQNYTIQQYNGLAFNGQPTLGTPVGVTVGGATTGINFAISSGGAISGKVTGDASAPLGSVQIVVYASDGKLARTVSTDALGNYFLFGLPAGTYYVSTNTPSFETPFYIDELYDNKPCLNCVTLSGAFAPLVTLPCHSRDDYQWSDHVGSEFLAGVWRGRHHGSSHVCSQRFRPAQCGSRHLQQFWCEGEDCYDCR
jgi:uncharacterized surface anchored protein